MAEYNEEFDRLRRNRVQVSYHQVRPGGEKFWRGACGRLPDGAAVPGCV